MITATASMLVDSIRHAANQSEHDIDEVGGLTAMALVVDTVTQSSSLTPDGRMFALAVMGADHDYLSTVKIAYGEAEPEDAPSVFAAARHDEFVTAVFKVLEVPETEPVRHVVLAWRMPDFSLQTCLMEADGTFHDLITAPVFGRAIGSNYAVTDPAFGMVCAVGRRFWGKAWSAQRCHHNKKAPEGVPFYYVEGDEDDRPLGED